MTASAEEGAAEERSPDERIKMTVSERSIGTSSTTALQDWLADRLGRPGQLTVSGVRTPDSGGLSSTSVLFEASWISQGTRQGGAYVARMAPEDSAVPVFPRYDLAAQFEVIGQVAARCSVPLPKLRWNEPDGGPLGTPFFVMDQVDGRIPLDNPPYVFTGWLLEATPVRACPAAARQRRDPGRAARDSRAERGVPRAAPACRPGLPAVPCGQPARLLPLGAR